MIYDHDDLAVIPIVKLQVLGLGLGVDLVFPLSQEQEVEQQQQQEPSPKSKLEFDTKDQVLFLTLLNGYTYSFETS